MSAISARSGEFTAGIVCSARVPLLASSYGTKSSFGYSRLARIFLLFVSILTATFSLLGQDTPAQDTASKPLAFRDAVDLALQHSGVMSIATINQWRAHSAYREARDNYIPQLTVGSGLGYSYGFPLTLEGSAPSVVNFNSSQSLFNLQLQQYIKAARIDWKATSFDIQDKRGAVILDTALTYAQLQQLAGKKKTLQEAQQAADKAASVTQQRLDQGVDSKLDLTRSQLAAARIRLRIAEADSQGDVLREHLSKLVGVPPEELQIVPDSMPAIPAISQEQDIPSVAAENSPSVKLAEQKAAAADARAKGEHRGTLPTIDLATQYAYLAKFNNYDLYYLRYTPNNFSGGLNIRFPFFNSVQKQKAAEADSDALIAHKQAEQVKNQVIEDTLKLQRSLPQLAAARDVAKLEWQVALGDQDAVNGRSQIGQANVRDQQNAQLTVDDSYAAYLDAEFELSRTELQLMRVAGELENWAFPPR